MGRKPNQLILEYFHRGAKLEDASNRYQHTCRSCGENFPKGRIDSLTNHLVKKCSAIPLRDRQQVLLRLHDLPPDVSAPDTGGKTGNNGPPDQGRMVDLPFAPRQNFDGLNVNGLNVLAEAARQEGVSDQTQKRTPSYSSGVNVGGKTVVVDPALEAMQQPVQADGTMSKQSTLASTVSSAPSLPPFQFLPLISQSPSGSPRLPSLSLHQDSAPTARQSSQLSMIAASAMQNEMVPQGFTMEPDIGLTNTEMSSRLFDAQGALITRGTWPMQQGPSADPTFFDGVQEHNATIEAATQRAATFPRPIAANPNTPSRGFVNDFGNSTKPPKPKVRGRFSASRRKEVQDVRKKGACMRCRMLKKPCSDGHPCDTCRKVESARLWKQPCVRTRIADEFELYSAGLHATLAYHDVNNVKSQVQFDHFPGRIEVTHYEDPSIYITFIALEGHKQTASLDPALNGFDTNLAYDAGTDLRLLDGDSDDLPGKLEQYMKKMAPTFYEREQSDFMKPTLTLASDLSTSKKDELLARVLELWIATHILVDLEMRWKTFSNPTLPPSTTPTKLPSSVPSLGTASIDARTSIDEDTNPWSYALLCSQLRSAAEKRAAQLSKQVMNDLERRLLLRQQSGWFETFLVALVLLNCVERTCWLFRTWEADQSTQSIQRWPLDRRPPYYADQGERFSEILHMLLKMRGLPPKTSPRPDNGILKTIDGSDESASKWFETIRITPQFLEQRQAAVFDQYDSRSLELKYCAKLLQPTNCYT